MIDNSWDGPYCSKVRSLKFEDLTIPAISSSGMSRTEESARVLTELQRLFAQKGIRINKSSIKPCLRPWSPSRKKAKPFKLWLRYLPKYAEKILEALKADVEKRKLEAFEQPKDSGSGFDGFTQADPFVDGSKPLKEKAIQLWLQKQIGGEIEQKTKHGFVDLLTESVVFEIKRASQWKHAIGQIVAYAYDYPGRRKAIVLFDDPEFFKSELIADVCALIDVEVWAVVGTKTFRLYQVQVSRHLGYSQNSSLSETDLTTEINQMVPFSAVDAFAVQTDKKSVFSNSKRLLNGQKQNSFCKASVF